jgi:uncharacterized BrkB/YihY/UPF0761 family membrane protein
MANERFRSVKQQVTSRFELLEAQPILGFPIASYRRFKEIGGKQLAFVVGGNLFVSVIPLFIIGYAIIEKFNPDRSFAVILIERFHLDGETAALVRSTFTNARSGQSTALSLSVVSLFVTGFGVATTVQTAYARAFRVAPLRGVRKFARGAAWLALMLGVTGLVLTLRYWSDTRPWWFLAPMLPALALLNFVFFLVSPRLLLDLPFAWRHLVPGAVICVVVNGIVGAVSAAFLRNWLDAYGRAYGGFGVTLAFLAWIGVLATFWVWIGAIAGVYWERFAGAGEVAAIEEISERAAGT